MDFIVKFQTWVCHRLYGLGSDWSSFIHKSWKESMHTQHMEVFFLNQVHMVALLSAAAWHAQSWERQEALGLCAQQKWYFRHWYLMEGQELGTTAISRAPLHMEAIISNGVLRQFPQSKRNHWNSYPSLSSPSVLLLLVQQYTGLVSAEPRLNHYFFLCSSARLMIRGSQGLISNFKTKKKKMPLWCSISARL